MKALKTVITILIIGIGIGMGTPAQGQFWKKLKEHAKEKIKREAERRSQRRVDKGIDKSFDEAEDVLDGKKKRKKKKKKRRNRKQRNEEGYENENQNYDNDDEEYTDEETSPRKRKHKKRKKYTPKVVWSKYDFVPGDEVIFEDAPDAMEENGEFPSRWDLHNGNAEIMEVDGEPVISLRDGDKSSIIPYLKDSEKDYLPEVFTIEFDYYIPERYNGYARGMELYLHDRKNQRGSINEFNLYQNSVSFYNASGDYPGTTDSNSTEGKWRHLALAYTRGKLKIYLDDTRLINIPHLKGNPSGFTISKKYTAQDYFIKNIRIAKGGVKYYDRVMQDGKIVCNGIRFDVGKTTLKPESMGSINKIYRLMSKKPEIKFSVEGHTDSDGNDATNQKLSEGRAKVVMEKLVKMGISQDRLSSKGWGESKPVAPNNTAEGKANNRRVEFVVIK